jgi:hypothetical protein
MNGESAEMDGKTTEIVEGTHKFETWNLKK